MTIALLSKPPRMTRLVRAIRAMFASGEQGGWYDPSDLSTLYQDSAGTTPVTAVEQPVGLMLDKSKGLVLGPELVTNGTFDTNITGWSNFSQTRGIISWDSANKRLKMDNTTGTGDNYTWTLTTVTAGNTYKFSVNLIDLSGTTTVIKFYWFNGTSGIGSPTVVPKESGTVISTAPAGATSILIGSDNTKGIWEIDNISVRELPGNHATQATSANRPTLSARVNLLTKTEQFDDAVWAKNQMLAFGSGSIANATTAPDGTLTADLLVPNTTAEQEHYVDVGASIPITSGTAYTLSWVGKAAGYKWLRLAFSASIAPSSARAAWFDVESGVKGTTQTNVTSTITALPNGFYRCTITRTATATVTPLQVGFAMITNADGGLGFTANGTSGMYWWGADLRPADQATGLLPAYQRVNTATDYDTVGFPLYLRFNGTSSSMATGRINFTSTDKMTVWAGVRKLSDANAGIVAELSENLFSNNGVFFVAAPKSPGSQTLGLPSKGTLIAQASTLFAAPITNVITGIGDISGDLDIMRVNGTQAASSTADQGTGTYGNYPLYIGARAGTSVFLNGHLYSLIIRGAQTSDAQITNAETWVNQKTKAYTV